MSAFTTLTVDDVVDCLTTVQQRSESDTSYEGHSVDLLAPFITELCNRSLSSGVFPAPFKSAFITPLLKKPELNPADTKSL